MIDGSFLEQLSRTLTGEQSPATATKPNTTFSEDAGERCGRECGEREHAKYRTRKSSRTLADARSAYIPRVNPSCPNGRVPKRNGTAKSRKRPISKHNQLTRLIIIAIRYRSRVYANTRAAGVKSRVIVFRGAVAFHGRKLASLRYLGTVSRRTCVSRARVTFKGSQIVSFEQVSSAR